MPAMHRAVPARAQNVRLLSMSLLMNGISGWYSGSVWRSTSLGKAFISSAGSGCKTLGSLLNCVRIGWNRRGQMVKSVDQMAKSVVDQADNYIGETVRKASQFSS